MHQSEALDKSILRNVTQQELEEQALYIQEQLTAAIIHKAFKQYTPEIYQLTGPEHEQIVKQRLQALPEVARRFQELHQKE